MMQRLQLLWELHRLRRNAVLGRRAVMELQEKKLRHILKYAYEHSAYYHRRFAEAGITEANIGTAPVTQFPVMDKDDLMAHFDDLVTVPDVKQAELAGFDAGHGLSEKKYLGKYHVVHSSGSTGLPRYFLYDDAAWNQMLLGIIRGALWEMSGMEIFKLLAAKPRILYLAATDGRYGGVMAVGDGIDGLGADQLQLNVNTPLIQWKQALKDFRPNVIIGYPSALKILAGLQAAGQVRLSLTRIITCGEPLPGSLRAYLESVFGLPVVNFYGSSESLAMGVETDADVGMFLFDDLNYIEMIDGKMYFTCLYNEVQPIIRYQLSDKLTERQDILASGCSFHRVDAVEGRDEDILWFSDEDGNREFLHPLSVEGICVDGLVDYQFRQISRDAFELRAQTGKNADRVMIQREVSVLLRHILAEKRLGYVRFFISFTDQILPDPRTGKKPLIVKLAG